MTFFSDKLKELRLQSCWTQSWLADKLGVTQVSVSQYENAERFPTTTIIKKMAKAFDVPTHGFFNDLHYEKTVLIEKIKKMTSPNIKKILEFLEFLEWCENNPTRLGSEKWER